MTDLREKTEQPELESYVPRNGWQKIYDLLAAEGGGTWATYVMIDIDALIVSGQNSSELERLRQELASASADCKRANEMINAAVTDYNEAIAEIKARSDAYEQACRERDEARAALAPFAACCFADNGDVTINSSRLCAGHFLRAATLTTFEQREGARALAAGKEG